MKTLVLAAAWLLAAPTALQAQAYPRSPVYVPTPRPYGPVHAPGPTYGPVYAPSPTYVVELPRAGVDEPRLRLALTGGAALGAGELATFGGVASLQLGVQVDDLFAVYYRGSAQGALVWDRPSAGSAGMFFHAVVVDLTLGDAVQLGAGPSFDHVLYSACGQLVCVDAGTVGFGGEARVALTLPYFAGHQRTLAGRSRGALVIELVVHAGAYGIDRAVFGHAQVGLAAGWMMY
ncbi:MAG: hypothetical protein K8H88_25790 [Sandaracinaceae bacterium]|nr:hypothetical protein [Sandaracinaceae bacterium]